MLHDLKHKNSKTMGREAVRWQILTIAFLSLLIGVFCFAANIVKILLELIYHSFSILLVFLVNWHLSLHVWLTGCYLYDMQ